MQIANPQEHSIFIKIVITYVKSKMKLYTNKIT